MIRFNNFTGGKKGVLEEIEKRLKPLVHPAVLGQLKGQIKGQLN